MVRKDAQAVRNAVENEGRINLLFYKTTCIDEIKRIIMMIAGQTYENHHETCLTDLIEYLARIFGLRDACLNESSYLNS